MIWFADNWIWLLLLSVIALVYLLLTGAVGGMMHPYEIPGEMARWRKKQERKSNAKDTERRI